MNLDKNEINLLMTNKRQGILFLSCTVLSLGACTVLTPQMSYSQIEHSV